MDARAQWLLHNSLSPETQFPNAAMSPTAYNLDKANTKYLTNFAYPAPPPLPAGSSLELAGWSTSTDGGFTFGESAPPLPPLMSSVYTGHGAVALSNVRDVQVGYLKNGSDNYIIAAYYDNVVQLYGYNLYKWNLVAKTATFLYTLHFQNPNFIVPAYTPNNGYIPVIDGMDFPDYPPPALTSTMAYNRISMDIHKDADKVVMVMTDGTSGYMYTTAGIIGVDTVVLCPNLPPMPSPLTITSTPYTVPTPEFDYFSGLYSYVLNPTTGDYDYFHAPTGIHIRYLASLGSPATYHYSYYPIDKGLFVTEFIRYSPTSTLLTQLPSAPKPPSLYAPLIRLKPMPNVVTPCLTPYYYSLFPDVAFGGDNLSYVFYADWLRDLYVNDHTSPISFNDLYSYIGGSIPTYVCFGAGQTDMPLRAMNTADGRPISSYYLSGALPGESAYGSLEPEPPAYLLDIWPHIDAPDLGVGNNWAVTYAFKPFATKTFSYPGVPDKDFHLPIEFGKYNIYIRSNFQESILTNGSMGNAAINIGKNVSPSISFKPMTTTNVSVAWASEDAGTASGSNFAYIGTEINTTVPYSTTSPSSLVTLNDYLHVSSNPSFDAGNYPLVSLSKHTDGLDYLYTAYAQEDAMGTYSLIHKNKPTASTSFWKTTNGDKVAIQTSIGISPNPFSNSLHITSSEPLTIVLTDLLGRNVAKYQGSADELNKRLDVLAPTLVSGTYLLKAFASSGQHSQVFKLTKL